MERTTREPPDCTPESEWTSSLLADTAHTHEKNLAANGKAGNDAPDFF